MNVLAAFQKVKVFIFDIDGVMTNGQILLDNEAHFLRSMNVKDGQALVMAVKAGYPIVAISGGNSEPAVKRLLGFGVKSAFINVRDKRALLQQLVEEHQWKMEEILYMGDDVPDLTCMKMVGLSACPQDACMDVLDRAFYISPMKGGHGCVRDVIEKTMKLQGKWPKYE